MKICLAQTSSFKDDIQKNIERHTVYVKKAIESRADLICFSELSMTGYEPELAESLATTPADARFDVFQELADSGDITICIGVPTSTAEGISISMIIFQPNFDRQTYSKQYLHSDEMPYFMEGKEQIIIDCKGKKIAPAICYESLLPKHFDNARTMGIDIYLASVAKPERNVQNAYSYFPTLAKDNKTPVLMVNSVGSSDNFISAGRTAVWDANGELIDSLNSDSEGILVINN